MTPFLQPRISAYTTAQNQPVRLYNSSDNMEQWALSEAILLYRQDRQHQKRVTNAKYYLRSAWPIPFITIPVSINFYKMSRIIYSVFPDYYYSSTFSRDSLTVSHVQNAFSYSFYLRGKSTGVVKNEVKLDLGLVQDYYRYQQFVTDTIINTVSAGSVSNRPEAKQFVPGYYA